METQDRATSVLWDGAASNIGWDSISTDVKNTQHHKTNSDGTSEDGTIATKNYENFKALTTKIDAGRNVEIINEGPPCLAHELMVYL